MSHDRLMVAVVLLYKGIGFSECHRNKDKTFLLAHRLPPEVDAAVLAVDDVGSLFKFGLVDAPLPVKV